jgi:hypothetical protein
MPVDFFKCRDLFLGSNSLLQFSVHFLIKYMLITCFSVPVLHIVLIRATKKYGESGLPLISSCAVGLIGWFIASLYALSSTPFGLTSILLPPILTSLFIYFGFVIGYLEFFSLINRGYSLSIMMDISRRVSPPNAIELEREYAGGKGLRWMLTKRVNGLTALKLVKEENGKLILIKGWPERIAWMLRRAKIIFSIQGSG